MIRLVCALALVAGCKGKEPAEKPPPAKSPDAAAVAASTPDAASSKPDGAYREALRAGRAAARAEKWDAAIAAFEKALAARPDDPRASSELGWVAFRGGRLELARRANETAVAGARSLRLRAASLYNLGRIAEAKRELDKAAGHYRASLRLREHKAVRARLDKLEKGICAKPSLETFKLDKPTTAGAICKDAEAEDENISSCDVDVDSAGGLATATMEAGTQTFEALYLVRGAELYELPLGTYSSGRGYSETLGEVRVLKRGERTLVFAEVARSDDMRDSDGEGAYDSEPVHSVCAIDNAVGRCLLNSANHRVKPEVDKSGAVRWVPPKGEKLDPCLAELVSLW